MKHAIIFIFLIVTLQSYGQTLAAIDSSRNVIDDFIFTDSIIIGKSNEASKDDRRVVAFLRGDTLFKTIATYANSSKQIVTYYEQSWHGYSQPVYISSVDRNNAQVLLEIYVKDADILQLNIYDANTDSINFNQFLRNFDFSTDVSFSLVDRRSKKYMFTGKLVKAVSHTPGCGITAWAIVQKFQVLSTTFPNYDKKYVLIIQTCPECVGKKFFKKGKIYEINVATNIGVSFNHTVINSYDSERLPTYWTRKIKRIR